MTKIEWTDETWNPVTGCDKISQGCKNCYAEKMHKRLMGMFPEKYSKPFLGNIELHASELFKPISRKKPTWYFVNSMSDLFHEDVPFDFIDNVFAVMDCCPQHTFQILTKRPDRMLAYLRENRSWRVGQLKVSYDSSDYDLNSWPLKNVILGTSAEDQENYNRRAVPMVFVRQLGWTTMLSAEPLLGKLQMFIRPGDIMEHTFNWVIVGGESGHKARPMHPQWVRDLRDECDDAGVPFFFKQWGEWAPEVLIENNADFQLCLDSDAPGTDVQIINIRGKHNNRIFIEGITEPHIRVLKLGKKSSGNILDGHRHLQFPELLKTPVHA